MEPNDTPMPEQTEGKPASIVEVLERATFQTFKIDPPAVVDAPPPPLVAPAAREIKVFRKDGSELGEVTANGEPLLSIEHNGCVYDLQPDPLRYFQR